jgi:hypothetical protein
VWVGRVYSTFIYGTHSLIKQDNHHKHRMSTGSSASNDATSENHQTIILKDFQFDHARAPHPTVLLVGKRFAGKSAMQVAIAEAFPVPRWSAWCGTKDTEDFWADRFGSSASVWGPDERGKEALRRIIAYQQAKVRLYKKILKLPFPLKYSIGLVFDDVTSKREFRKGEILEDLFSNGRHYKAVILISCQYIKQLPPAVRTNTDYLFMMHNSKRTAKLLHEEYVENPDDFGVFLGLLRRVTGQKDEHKRDLFNGLVYDNMAKTVRLNEMFYVFRHYEGFDPETVQLGHPDWRRFNSEHYKDTERDVQLAAYRKKKRILRLQQYQTHREDEEMNIDHLDLDVLSDSGDDVDSEEEFETCHVHKRNGQKGIVLQMHKGKTRLNTRRVEWHDSPQVQKTTQPPAVPPPPPPRHNHRPRSHQIPYNLNSRNQQLRSKSFQFNDSSSAENQRARETHNWKLV